MLYAPYLILIGLLWIDTASCQVIRRQSEHRKQQYYSADDPIVQYPIPWNATDARTLASQRQDQTLAIFWNGGNINLIGSIQDPASQVSITLDNVTRTIVFNPPGATGSSAALSPVYTSPPLEFGDHELLLVRSADSRLRDNAVLSLSEIVIEVDSSTPDVPESAYSMFSGPLARIVNDDNSDSQAEIVVFDDSAPELIIADPTAQRRWYKHKADDGQFGGIPVFWLNGTSTMSSTAGGRIRFEFGGSSIWLFGQKYWTGGMANVFIDGGLSGTINYFGYQSQTLLWSTEDLRGGLRHVLEIEPISCPYECSNCEEQFTCASIDFIQAARPSADSTIKPAFNGKGLEIMGGLITGMMFISLISLSGLTWKLLQ